MSYKRIHRWVGTLVDDEYEMAAEEHGKVFASPHEGFSVIQEELEETIDEAAEVGKASHRLWDAVKSDDNDAAVMSAEEVESYAINVACEAIQVAAMAHKFVVSFGEDDSE